MGDERAAAATVRGALYEPLGQQGVKELPDLVGQVMGVLMREQ